MRFGLGASLEVLTHQQVLSLSRIFRWVFSTSTDARRDAIATTTDSGPKHKEGYLRFVVTSLFGPRCVAAPLIRPYVGPVGQPTGE
jgi:hypothetical protein